MSSATKWFSITALFLGVVVAMLWSGDDGPPARIEGAKADHAAAVVAGQIAPAPPALPVARETTPSAVDFSPPPGNTAQASSAAWPFAAPERGSGGAPAAWGKNLMEVVDAYWRAALSRIVSAVTPAPATSSPPAAPSAPATPAANAVASPGHEFETPPGVGSPRGSK